MLDGLIKELVNSNIKVKIIDLMVTVLAYADDLVLIAPTSAGMQQLLNIVKVWCTKWRLTVNKDKTKIMHVRPKRVEQSGYAFTYGEQSLSKVEKYKY